MVVAVEEVRKCSGAVALAGVGSDVGPLVEQGAVEALYLSIGLRSVGSGSGVRDGELGAKITPSEALVSGAVVGEDTFDGHVVECEPVVRAFEEAGAADGVFGVQDLAVGDAAVRIDGGMYVVVADRVPGLMRGVAATVGPSTATVGDPAELFDIDVHELTRP